MISSSRAAAPTLTRPPRGVKFSALPIDSARPSAEPFPVISVSYQGISRYQSHALFSDSVSVALETRSGNAKSMGTVALTLRSLK